MKKRFLILLSTGFLVFSTVASALPMVVRAEPETTQEVIEEVTDEVVTTEEETSSEDITDESTEEVVEVATEENAVTEQSEEIGDELAYVLNTDTNKSDETPCQVTASFTIPSGFTAAR